MAYQEQYDSALLGILQNEGNIQAFLDVLYGFLYRRTDFYLELTDENPKVGFPPGVALKLGIAAFQKYQQLAEKDKQRKEKTKKQEEKDKASPPVTMADHNPAEPTVSTTECPATSAPPGGIGDMKAECTVQDERSKQQCDNISNDGESSLQAYYQSRSESYNGAIRENYAWSQSITDVDARVFVPNFIKKGKDVRVSILKKHLKVEHKDEAGQWKVVVDDALPWEIHKEESLWSLDPGQHVHVNMEKVQERWWDALLEGEPKINVQKIDPSRPMSDLDDEAQSKIAEMMYNERQKKLGLPQSHEQKVHDMLKDAWDAEGSPFKGQAFDMSKVNIAPS